MKFFIQMQCLVTLTLVQFSNRNTGPSGDDLGNLFLCYTLMYQTHIFCLDILLFDLQLTLNCR